MKMFRKHVKRHLSAYCNGELTDEQCRGVAQHLLVCHGCRKEYEQVNLGARLGAYLQKVNAPDAIWSRIEDSLEVNPECDGARWPAPTPWMSGWRLKAIAAGLALMLAAGAVIYLKPEPKAAWDVGV